MARNNYQPKNPHGEIQEYPKYDDYRGGCKVSWYYYDDHAKALEASKVAKHNARVLAWQGYDFGYQSPGAVIRVMRPSPMNREMYQVCIP